MKQEGINKQEQKGMYYPNLSLFIDPISEKSSFYYRVIQDEVITEQLRTKIHVS